MNRKATIAAAFGRAAPSYDAHAEMQRQAADLLATRIAALPLAPAPRVLELGCGTGFLTRHLAAAGAHGLITDLAPAMVAATRARIGPDFIYAAMDGELPAVAPDFDLICASLALQWFERPEASLRHLGTLLRPGGWLAFSTLGPRSLLAWRKAIAAEAAGVPTPPFWSAEPLAATWRGEVRLDSADLCIAYPSARAFLAGLRAIGADTPRPGHKPLSPGQLRGAMARFEQTGFTADYAVTFACLRVP